MGMLNGKSAIITGAGRGLGREEAILLAKHGCNVLINDLGSDFDGSGKETRIADEVVEECKGYGVKAIANYESVADYNKVKEMIDQAISTFGSLDIVVNNAGILRDRMLFNMTEQEFDAVIAVHLKGTFNIMRHAAQYFRTEVKKSPEKKNFGRIINTSSDSGLLGNIGQVNYGAAKAAIASMTLIASAELRKYATVNCISPLARTRMTTDATPQTKELYNSKGGNGFDIFNPRNVSPLIVFLASDEAKKITGEVFRIAGDKCWVYRGWHTVNMIENSGKSFTPEILAERVKDELLKNIPKRELITDSLAAFVNF